MKKKKLLVLALSTVFLLTNTTAFIPKAYSQNIKIKPSLQINYNDKNNGDISVFKKIEEESNGVKSFDVEGSETYFLDSYEKKVVIFNNNKFSNEFKLNIDTPMDIGVNNGVIYISDNQRVVYKFNIDGTLLSKEKIQKGGGINAVFSRDAQGKLFLDDINVDTGLEEDDAFNYSIKQSLKDSSKFINVVSKDNSITREISFVNDNGGSSIIGEDKYGNTYVDVKDIKIGVAVDSYENIIYKIDNKGNILDKYYVPVLNQYVFPHKYVTVDSEGNIFYLHSTEEGVEVYKLAEGKSSILEEMKNSVESFFNNNVSAISRKEAQDRAYQMANLTWHYQKSKNGNVISHTALPDQFNNKADSTETGIPYNWGGFDGLDTTSSSKWKNYLDAVLNKNAFAGNVDYSAPGYIAGTAGLDCSGFIQSVLKIGGSKLGTWSLGRTSNPLLTPIRYDGLKNMDILLDINEHVVFFKSWQYDGNGGIIGANTIECTGNNSDGTGEKVKNFYRTIDELSNGYGDGYSYKAERYVNMGTDYIETHTAQPSVISPLYMQVVDKTKPTVTIQWNFNDAYANGTQSAYRVSVYQGDIATGTTNPGSLMYTYTGNGTGNSVSVDTTKYPNSTYYFSLETKNNNGYWCNPVLSPFIVTDNVNDIPKKTTFGQEIRYAGNTRYETSKAVAQSMGSSFDNIVVATGNNYPDALSGTTLAKQLNAPIVLVNESVQASSDNLNYITSVLKPGGKVYILGGTGAVPQSIENYIKNKGIKTVRYWGAKRIQTSLEIAKNVSMNSQSAVFIATDSNYPDALSASSAAGYTNSPILLSSCNSLDYDVQNFLKAKRPAKVYICGGNGVISDSVVNTIKNLLSYGDDKVVRLGGKTRFETSQEINENFYSSSPNNLYLTTAYNYPDALCSGVSAAISGSPIMLIAPDNFARVTAYMNDIKAKGTQLVLIGGSGVVDEYTISRIKYLCN